jgi:SulP family sulfate permease
MNWCSVLVSALTQRHIDWERFLPFLFWMKGVDRQTMGNDLAAGLTGSLILVPQGVAFAMIAGMPPAYGLYTALVPTIVAALFGSSFHLVSGPTTAISIVVFSALSPLATPGSAEFVGLALSLSLLSGIIMLALGWLRLGALMNFVSHTVVVGFTAGAAVLIAASQFKNFFGLAIPSGSKFHQAMQYFFSNIGEINVHILGVAVATLVTGVLARKFFKAIPHMIVALVIGSALAALLNIWFGDQQTGIHTLAALPRGLPPLSWPDLSMQTISELLPVALAISLLSLTEALSIARALALKTDQRINPNQEFIGQGLSNVAGAFFSSYPSSGSFNRSGLNLEAGARTPLAAVFSALFLLAIMQVFAPLAMYLPLPTMAGVLFLVAWGLIDFHHIAHILRSSRQESAVLAVTFLSTLFLRLEFAIYVGVLMSLSLYLHRTSRPVVEDVKPVKPDQSRFIANTCLPDCPQLKMLRINGSLFFGAVDHVQQAMLEVDAHMPTQKHLLLVCPGVNFIDLAGAQMLTQEARRRRRLGGDLYLFNLRELARQTLKQSGCEDALGGDNIFPLGVDVIGKMVSKLDHDLCAACTRRIFYQCDACPINPQPAPIPPPGDGQEKCRVQGMMLRPWHI